MAATAVPSIFQVSGRSAGGPQLQAFKAPSNPAVYSDKQAAQGGRGGGFGLDADILARQEEKCNNNRDATQDIQEWVERRTGTPFTSPFAEALRDGTVLCDLANALHPGSVAHVNTVQAPFKQMENISNFLVACRALGVCEHSLFETVDLHESKDLFAVVQCLSALRRAVEETSTTAATTQGNNARRVATPVDDESLPTAFRRTKQGNKQVSTQGSHVNPAHCSGVDSEARQDGPAPPTPVAAPVTVGRSGTGRQCGFGLDADIAARQEQKYSTSAEDRAKEWITAVTGATFNSESFGDALKTGEILCQLACGLRPGSVRRINTSTAPFKQMENISNFLVACRAIGVDEHSLFETCDLFELKDLGAVLQCLFSLSRAASAGGFSGPLLISEEQERANNSRPFHNGNDPTKILQRSDEPLLSPSLAWEIGTAPALCNVPNVVFLEAAHPTSAKDEFRVYFGGADTVIGSALVAVTSNNA